MTLLAAALAASLQVRHVSVPAGTDGGSVRIECPVGQTTRIVFPDRFVSLKASAGAQEALGLLPEASRPKGILRVTPPTHPAQGRVRVNAPTGSLIVILRTVPTGRGSEIRLTQAAPVPVAVSGQPIPPKPTEPGGGLAAQETSPQSDPRAASQMLEDDATSGKAPALTEPPASPGEAPVTAAVAAEIMPSVTLASPLPSPVSSPEAGLAPDASDLLRATPVRIGRREGRPGQREMVLDDALKGENSVWLRFTLKKGAKREVTRVWWSEGDIRSFAQEPAGDDLKLRVQLPRASVKRDSKLNVAVSGEGDYRFALKDSSFLSLFKSLFY